MEFTPWPKIGRLNRDIIVTEKIDGTNAAIRIVQGARSDITRTAHVCGGVRPGGGIDGFPCYDVYAQSRNRIIYPGKDTDNAGFAAWVEKNAYVLADFLGEGIHFGEWWGQGIQRGYNQDSKRFSLFNTNKWADIEQTSDGLLRVVPVLYHGPFSESAIQDSLDGLRHWGSRAASGFYNPEGVVVFHTANSAMFKVTLEGDEKPKGSRE